MDILFTMMKGVVMKAINIFLIVVICFVGSVWAYDEPMFFRDMRFCRTISEYSSKLEIVEDDGNLKFYKNPKESLKIGRAKLTSITYGFYDDVFFSVMIKFENYGNSRALLDAMKYRYGEPDKPNRYMERYYWHGEDVSISFDYREITRRGEVYIMYKPLSERMKQSNSRAAENARDDF